MNQVELYTDSLDILNKITLGEGLSDAVKDLKKKGHVISENAQKIREIAEQENHIIYQASSAGKIFEPKPRQAGWLCCSRSD